MVNSRPGSLKPQPGAQDRTDAEQDRRRHRRVDMELQARFLTEKGQEMTGTVLNISAGGAMIRAKFPPAFGESVILYLDQIGRVEGKVVRSGNNCFAVAYTQRKNKQSKIADSLTAVLNNRRKGADRRNNPRIQNDAPTTVFLEDGRQLECSIVDISLTGASIEITPRPPLGSLLILGRMKAKVVRRHDNGVGVVFTGSAERMDEVVENTGSAEPLTTIGPGFAPAFGKKGASA